MTLDPEEAVILEQRLHLPRRVHEAPEGIPELTDAYAPVEALQNF